METLVYRAFGYRAGGKPKRLKLTDVTCNAWLVTFNCPPPSMFHSYIQRKIRKNVLAMYPRFIFFLTVRDSNELLQKHLDSMSKVKGHTVPDSNSTRTKATLLLWRSTSDSNPWQFLLPMGDQGHDSTYSIITKQFVNTHTYSIPALIFNVLFFVAKYSKRYQWPIKVWEQRNHDKTGPCFI